MNEFATKRQIDELFRSFKSDNSPFKKAKSTNKCDPVILKKYFETHFTKPLNENNPIEIDETPQFLQILQ